MNPKPLDASRIILSVADRGCENPHETEREEQQSWMSLYEEMNFCDDVNSGLLDKDLVVKAHKLGMEFPKRLGVYKQVHRSMPRGHKTIPTRWVDTNRGDLLNPDYRSRLLGRGIKQLALPMKTYGKVR